MDSKIPPVHPGIYIGRGLKELEMSNAQAAEILDCSRAFVGDIIHGKRDLSVEMCFKISELLGSTPEFWVRLQAQYDVKMAERNRHIAAATKKVHARVIAYKKAMAA